ncbi:hypothetical protein COC42_15935 [Sphingomonas spermidinifaciens]|uniref:Peptidase S8/S53 domain-containing protein n=1 Tax=Sphingomonas spermidinifaciens TaxID=1141889 RepID=A0A2A4B1K1_9SPHN|nr:S8 family serine peptidase [Sphingomonas spermidinifaciens]PCD01618.1 hypothetical protein COC42_15935 [Sphingomonas spermidinifaciens]
MVSVKGRLGAAALAVTVSAVALTAPAAAQDVPAPKPLEAKTTSARPLASQAGTITPTRGMIRAHMDEISPFWSDGPQVGIDVDPETGELEPFWGKLEPYRGMIRAHEGELTALAGMIRAHEGDLEGMRGMIRAHMGELSATARMIRAHDTSAVVDYAAALSDYRAFISQSEAFWAVPVQKETGKSFSTVITDPLLNKYGIDLNDAQSLAKLSGDQREMFFLEWHDNLMQFSGADQVDHWMKSIGWSPALTQQQGSGTRAVIGLVDFFVAKDPDIAQKVIYSGGYTAFTGHGAGVGSLILASHDGKGVMGIAPNARVAAYNPFDATHTASWTDVTKGIIAVNKAGANVINLSLGVPGHTFHSEWRNVFKTSEVNNYKDTSLYVIAAGNSGVTQTANVNFKDAFDNTFLVVGSVSPDNVISDFSNRPGFVCLTDDGTCKNTMRAGVGRTGDTFLKSDYLKESGLLMNRFLVAPGEMILVADGEGGVTRMSGTSFAAPLVAGAIALIHDRWPWLKKYPRDVAKILLDSATDLGEPGADPVYGRGLLNIERAQGVLDFDRLKYELWNGSSKTDLTVSTLKTKGFQQIWSDKDMYFAAFEKIDSAERDFLIPLSSRLFGTMRNGQYFQEFVYNHFVNWLQTGVGFTGVNPQRGFGFTDTMATPDANLGNGWSFSMTGRLVAEHYGGGGIGAPQLRSSVTVAAPQSRVRFTFGSGDGAVSLGGRMGLQTSSDFDPYTGGVNPLLGFASGGAHVASTLAVSRDFEVSFGATSRRMSTREMTLGIADIDDRGLMSRNRYAADAMTVRVDYRPANWLGVSGSFTRLEEDRAFLGTLSLANSDFGDGTTTDGITVQADLNLDEGMVVFGSATGARTANRDDAAAFRMAGRGALGSAYQIGAAKQGLLGRNDRLRMTLAQPLTIERGAIEFTSIMVIDRETGDKGPVTQRFDLGNQRRRAVAEVLYGTPLMGGLAELSMFGRGELRAVDAAVPRIMIGAQGSMRF